MENLKRLLEKKFLNDRELVHLEDSEYVLSIKLKQPYNAHYNEYLIKVEEEDKKINEYFVYLKHR